MEEQAKSTALLILFPGFNTLDMNGPYEVLRQSGKSQAFSIDVASETEITTSAEGAQVKRDIALDEGLIASLARYDLLIVPGGPSDKVEALIVTPPSHFINLVDTFANIPPSQGQPPRILLSICTGAIIPGYLGIFSGRYCTTHWLAYKTLAGYVNAAAEQSKAPPGTVLPARFVDAGENACGVRIISSGGISCGIDASLYVVKLRVGEPVALETAQLLDYPWRKTEGVVFGIDFSK